MARPERRAPAPPATSDADIRAERAFLAETAQDYRELGSETEKAQRRAAMGVIRGLIGPGASVLELGAGDGYMSQLLNATAGRHVIVDAVTYPVTVLPPGAEFRQSLFEEFETEERFDLVVMNLILEHVRDPVALIARARAWSAPHTGRLFAAVPNQNALSRRLARTMGLIGALDDLTENDRAHGHRRCYDRVAFDRDIEVAGGTILLRGGLLLKPFANFQIDRMLEAGIIGREQLDGLEILGHEFPDLATALYAVFR